MSAPSLKSLASCAAERVPQLAESLGVLRDAALALARLHAAGSAHGAVSLENLALDEQGRVHLCRDTLAPACRSPEQEQGGPPDARSDVYGLGAAAWGLVNRLEAVPAPIGRLLDTMTAERPEDRYQSMDEVLTALEACELLTGIRACRPGHAPGPSGSPRRRLLALIVIALSLVVLGVGLLMALGRRAPPRGEPPLSYEHFFDKAEKVKRPLSPERR